MWRWLEEAFGFGPLNLLTKFNGLTKLGVGGGVVGAKEALEMEACCSPRLTILECEVLRNSGRLNSTFKVSFSSPI
ncbi:hypothetical protein L484_001524 [Morus notabilis]|uniref:Uncharacterized protein n=1 Tax=Morus notabilis TaxID=981085 RepID=W9QEC5_9ROSA|nr:hypothetical protein L484_001524 [Morus notabilis]